MRTLGGSWVPWTPVDPCLPLHPLPCGLRPPGPYSWETLLVLTESSQLWFFFPLFTWALGLRCHWENSLWEGGGRDSGQTWSYCRAGGRARASPAPNRCVWVPIEARGGAPDLAVGRWPIPCQPSLLPAASWLDWQLQGAASWITLPRIILGGTGRGVTHESVLLPSVAQTGQTNQLLPRPRLPFKASGQRKELVPAARLGPTLT